MESVERFKKFTSLEKSTLVKLCRNKFISLEEYLLLSPQECIIAKTIYRSLTPWKLLSNDMKLKCYLEEKEKPKYEHPYIWVSSFNEEEKKEEKENENRNENRNERVKVHRKEDYTIWRAVWLRVNCAHAFIEFKKKDKKLNLFINRHLDLIRYLDSLTDPRDDLLFLLQIPLLYKGLGHSYFDEDRNLIISTVIFHEPSSSSSSSQYANLPDCFHVMAQIALSGEQIELDFLLGKFLQKCLPFAGARRGLTDLSLESIQSNEVFWRLFSKIFYCLLKDKSFCFDKKRVVNALDLKNSETDKNCFVIFIAFRLWMIHMCKNQPHYISSGDIDWVKFEEDTNETAKMIYENFDPSSKDPFKTARDIFIKNNKNPKNRVYRYSKGNLINFIYDMMKTILEKEVFAELNNIRKDLKEYKMRGAVPSFYEKKEEKEDFTIYCNRLIQKMSIEISNEIKTNILNALVHIPRCEWLGLNALSILRVQKFGGIEAQSIYLILDLICMYHDQTAKSKHFDQILDKFKLWDFKVLTWYFYVVNSLNVIDFDVCQTHGEGFKPQLTIDRQVYFTICCKRIKTIQDQKFSHINVAFDLSRHLYICDKSNKKINPNNLDELGFSELDIQRKTNRKQQKDFNSIPCKDNPVFCILLDGFVLIYGKTSKYTHCPKCGNFHKFSRAGYIRDEYMCPTCKFNEEQENLYITCHVCNNPNPEKTKIIVEPLDINGIMNVYQNCYFCKKHFE